jgi:hypothetical protein
MCVNSAASFCAAACWAALAAALDELELLCALPFSALLAPCVATGSIACSSTLDGTCAAATARCCPPLPLRVGGGHRARAP